MSLKVSRNEETTEFAPPPAGTHLARCCHVIDLGRQYSPHYDKVSPKVLIGWELPNEMDSSGKPHLVWRRYTKSLHPDSNLCKILQAWRGRDFTAEELECFALSSIVGAPCMVTVSPAENPKYVNVNAVTAVLKGATVPDAISQVVLYDIDDHDQVVFDTLSENLRKTINSSEERAGKQHPSQQAAVDSPTPDEAPDDDVPF